MSDLPPARELLATSDLFGGLPGAALDALAAGALPWRGEGGAVIFQQGDPGDRFYLVARGAVRIGALAPDGRETTFNLILPGQVFGEIAALDGGVRTADASAATAGTAVYAVGRDAVLALVARDPELAMRMLRAVCARLRWVSGELEDARFLDLSARLAKRLLFLAEGFGKPVGDATRIELRLSQQDLAAHLSVTREAVNKQLRRWERAGMLRLARGYVTLVDCGALEAEAAPF